MMNGNGGVNNNSNNGFGKNGTGYLMVHYFRNYIVRPVGSLSATSTVDSLSSSYICTVNEANTIVPPPYSRAASPGRGASADRLESAQNEEERGQETSGDFNHVSRSQSMQQDRVGEDVQYCLTNSSHVNDPSNHMSHLQHQQPQQNQQQSDGHPMITGRSLSAPLADGHMELSTLLDEGGGEGDREYHRRRTASGGGFVAAASATRDWGNGCYANVDCSTGCGRERYHNEQMQRQSAGAVCAAGSASLVNVDVVVETSNGSSRQPEMKTTNNNKNNNCHSNESGYHNMMMLAAMNSRSPSLEHGPGAVSHNGGGSSSNSTGDGNCHGSSNHNSSSCCNILNGSTVCYSRSEYELQVDMRKLRSSLNAAADRGSMAKSIEERSVPWHNGPLNAGVERGRSLEDTESGLLMGYYRQQQQSSGSQLDKQQTLENFYPGLIGTKLDPKRFPPNEAIRPNSYHYSFNHNGRCAASVDDENDTELIEGGNSQMDRLTEELNDLFSGVERALSGVRVQAKRKSSGDSFDVQQGIYEESFNVTGSTGTEAGKDSGMSVKSPTDIANLGYVEKEGIGISYSDLRLDLAARARLIQRQMSIDQDQSFLSSLSRRDYMDSPPMLNNKSSLGGNGNPFENLVYINSSNTGSAVSSLVNMDCTPSSPPQATSPTDEMRELLEQINQLQRSEGDELENTNEKNHSIREEERIIQRLRRDSDREWNGEDVAVDSSMVRDWNININLNSISTATDNNGAMTTTSDTRNINNKSTKRPLSFQNNRCHFPGNLNLRGVSADEANAEESDLNFHSTAHKKVGSSLNSHLKGITSNSGRNSTQLKNEEQKEVTEEDEEVDKCFGNNYKGRGGVINNNGIGGRGVSKKPNKSFYIPVASHSPSPTASAMEARSPLEGYSRSAASRKSMGNPSSYRKGMAFSPTGGFPGMMFLGQGRKFGRLSRSAPSTPGTPLPTNKFDDISPLLLDEHEEEDHS